MLSYWLIIPSEDNDFDRAPFFHLGVDVKMLARKGEWSCGDRAWGGAGVQRCKTVAAELRQPDGHGVTFGLIPLVIDGAAVEEPQFVFY